MSSSSSSSLSAERVIEAFETASEENRLSSLRKHQLVHLPEDGDLFMTGDLHDHRRNFQKLVRRADLGSHPDRHIVLHELIHGDYFDETGAEESWRTLFLAADLKCDFPEQVHFMLANHDLAQIHGEGIMKAGLSVCEAFTAGVRKCFPKEVEKIEYALKDFLLSFPLGIKAANGIFCCHSLPTDQQVETFDYSVFNRELTGKDYARRTGPVYQLIWGRHMGPATAALFAEEVGADIIITGHQPQESGHLVNGPQHLILASDHNQGVFLPIDLTERYTMDQLEARIVKFASIE